MERRKFLAMAAGSIGLITTQRLFASEKPIDSISAATISDSHSCKPFTEAKMLLILVSLHHKNTEKIAHAFTSTLSANIKAPHEVTGEDIEKHSLVGFGSGIYDQMHHKSLLGFVDKTPELAGKKAFIFSTSGVSRSFVIKHGIEDPHTVLREKLVSKKCIIIGEFNCAGWNTNSFLKFFGGLNRGKPNADDLNRARQFAETLKYQIS
jgi:flavodoxin